MEGAALLFRVYEMPRMIRQMGHPDKGTQPGRMVAPPTGIGDAFVDEMHSIPWGGRAARAFSAIRARSSCQMFATLRTNFSCVTIAPYENRN